MRERIDIMTAIWLYDQFRNWREVARRMIRFNGMQFTTDAVQAAVRRHDKAKATA